MSDVFVSFLQAIIAIADNSITNFLSFMIFSFWLVCGNVLDTFDSEVTEKNQNGIFDA
jgi:hypothetical protein